MYSIATQIFTYLSHHMFSHSCDLLILFPWIIVFIFLIVKFINLKYKPHQKTRFSKREFWFWLQLGLKWYNEHCFKTTKNTVLTSLINRDSSSEVSKKLSPFASAEKESHIHEHYNVIWMYQVVLYGSSFIICTLCWTFRGVISIKLVP